MQPFTMPQYCSDFSLLSSYDIIRFYLLVYYVYAFVLADIFDPSVFDMRMVLGMLALFGAVSFMAFKLYMSKVSKHCVLHVTTYVRSEGA
jgi:hypothetical protein